MNNKYTIKVSAPLLRPGLTIETECSERYLVEVLKKIMDLVREFNAPQPAPEVVQTFKWWGTPEELARAHEQIKDRKDWRKTGFR